MKAFITGFKYAFSGLMYAIVHERNMRIHLAFLAYMIYFLKRYDFFSVSRAEFALLIIAAALVIALEYLNTAIERTVDEAVGDNYTQGAKIAKDTAAAAVLVAAIGAVACGIFILYQPEAFKAMFEYFKQHISRAVIVLISIAVTVAAIFILPSHKSEVDQKV